MEMGGIRITVHKVQIDVTVPRTWCDTEEERNPSITETGQVNVKIIDKISSALLSAEGRATGTAPHLFMLSFIFSCKKTNASKKNLKINSAVIIRAIFDKVVHWSVSRLLTGGVRLHPQPPSPILYLLSGSLIGVQTARVRPPEISENVPTWAVVPHLLVI